MRELSSPSCFAVGAHGLVTRLLCDHNDWMRNSELQILSLLQRVSLPQFFNAGV
jgi:hypothetical protein